eukprot:Rmarinus@m.22016
MSYININNGGFLVFAIFVFCLQTVSGLQSTNYIESDLSWEYLDRFCFAEKDGYIDYEAYIYTDDANMLVFYTDHEDDWRDIYKHPKEQCHRILSSDDEGIKYFYLYEGFNSKKVTVQPMTRPRWFFVAIANCYSNSSVIRARVDIHFVNDDLGWAKEFSYNQLGILELSIIMFIFFVLLTPLLAYCYVYLKRKNRLHPVFYLLLFSMMWFDISSFFFVIFWSAFAGNGEGVRDLDIAAAVFEMFGELTFIVLLFFVAYGWGVSTSHMSEVRYFAILVVGLTVSYVLLFVEEHVIRDRADFRYIYATSGGVAIITIRLIQSLFFCVCVLFKPLRYENDEEKRTFYVRFLFVYIIWFAGIPLSALVANAVDPWVRDIVVETFKQTLNLLAFLLLIYLFRPGHGLKIYTPHTVEPRRLKLRQDNKVTAIVPQVHMVHHDWASDGLQDYKDPVTNPY